MSKTKYIFVSGGVISALGKGITAASISLLLKRRGFKVCPIKCENNLNWDFGTVNPIEHGDPFLCFDGLEADQDLGNYERFLSQEVGHDNFMTMGQLYLNVINNERSMAYDGEDVEPIPHVVEEIIRRIKLAASKVKADFCVIELGGTVGEYENNNGLYYEAARFMALDGEKVANVHVTYVPVPDHVGEPKTKPAQFGIKELMRMGIFPNFIVVRSERPIDEHRKYKFSLKFHLSPKNIFSNENLGDIHEVPLHLHNQELDKRLLEYFGVKDRKVNLADWKDFVKRTKAKKKKTIKIAIAGKYFGTGGSVLNDSYHALYHSIKHAALPMDTEVEIVPINTEKHEKDIDKYLKDVCGIIVPIGWGSRGVEGKLKAIEYARKNKIPYLGLCYGMQLACVETARNSLKWKDATSEEVNPKSKHLIVHSIPFDPKYQVIKGQGTSMRLGTYPCVIKKGTLAYDIYSKYPETIVHKDATTITVDERHRHRFEVNNEYRAELEAAGMVFSGTSPDDFFVEMVELPKKIHPFFIACQFHPEYKSRPLDPHPLFLEFIKACK